MGNKGNLDKPKKTNSTAPTADALSVLSDYIYRQLNTPEAKRTRRLMALSDANPILKVRWDKSTVAIMKSRQVGSHPEEVLKKIYGAKNFKRPIKQKGSTK